MKQRTYRILFYCFLTLLFIGIEPNLPQTVRAATPTPAFKIAVETDGLYRLTFADLRNAGLDPTALDPRTLKLYNHDNEVAIVVTGAADGIFNESDLLLFYGVAIHNKFTTRNIYWLTAGGEPGRRMAQRDGSASGNATPAQRFVTTLHAEEDTAYWQTMPGTGEDRWFWGKRLSPNTQEMPVARPYPVQLTNLAPNTTATLRVQLKGYTRRAHRTRIHINSQRADEQTWSGQGQFTHQVVIPSDWLRNGGNEVLVETLNAGAAVDQILVNWIEVAHTKTYAAEENQLWFAAPGSGRFQFDIGQWSSNDVSVFDLSEPNSPVQIVNLAISNEGSQQRVRWQDDAQATSRYLALTAARQRSPASVLLDTPSNWKSPTQGADYIIITHENFVGAAQTLANHRHSQGLRVAVVLVGDIYDEFSGGVFHPPALRDFLAYTWQAWQRPAPITVVLLGDANQDYKDNLKDGTPNYVPSWNIETENFGEVSSDTWFAQVADDDAMPDLPIGRLSAQTAQEASEIVAKIIRYEQSPADPTWNQSVLFISDDDEPDFGQLSQQLATHLPFYYQVTNIDLKRFPPGDPTQEIVNAFHKGNVLINYAGHGEYYGWGLWDQNQRRIFENKDVEKLIHADRLPIITVANCLNGYFAGPKDNPALAELLQRRKDGGAAAIWAPTGLEYPSGHRLLMDEFYRAIFVDDQQTLGGAIRSAQAATLAQGEIWNELIATYVLFGDPATRLRIAPNYPYPLQVTPADGSRDLALDSTLQITFSKPLSTSSVVVRSVGAALTFTGTWDVTQRVVTFVQSGLQPGVIYQLRVDGQDRLGNAIGAGLVANPWSWTASGDVTAPAVVIEPLNGTLAGMPTAALFNLQFSEQVRTRSIVYVLEPLATGGIFWQADGHSASLVFTHLAVGQEYSLRLIGAQDRVGNRLQQPAEVKFVVKETFNQFLPLVGR